MTEAYIGIGSNQNNPIKQIDTALRALEKLPGSGLIQTSSIYSSKPVGPQDQPDYLNAVSLLETELPAHDLLTALKSIEDEQGRKRTRHWGPRSIDLDILLYGDQIISTERLEIPHPEMHRRGFVLVPLAEINPDLYIPGHGRIEQFLKQVNTEDIVPYDNHDREDT